MNVNSLYNEIGINSKQTISEQLVLLKNWFQKTISRDLKFTGEEQEQLNEYQETIKLYLETIVPKLRDDLVKPNPNLDNESMLCALASMGFDQVILSLKPNKKQLDTPNINGLTALHRAATTGNLNTTEVLLNLGANPNILNKQKQYPLFSSLLVPIDHSKDLIKNKIGIFNLLNDNTMNLLMHQDYSGNTVLHQMAIHNFSPLMAKLLKEVPKLAYLQNNLTHYPIHSAILNNQTENIKLLLNLPEGSLLPDKYDWLALHYAARYSSGEIIKLCCQATPNKDIPDYLGKTPLMLAAELGRLSAVEILIDQGAQITLRDQEGLNVWDYAAGSGNKELLDWLNKRNK
jgi:ankyrin repeat protein